MSPYTAETTAEQVASDYQSEIKNKTVLVTGASPGGLGAKFATVIAQHSPYCIILATRDVEKARKTAEEIAAISSAVLVKTIRLNLTSFKDTKAAAEEVLALGLRIDVLVNNAGIMAPGYSKTVDGVESQFATNHLGHFLFTNIILESQLKTNKNSGVRVVNVSSDGYRLGPVRFADWNFDDGETYNRWIAYGQSKTANMLFSQELAKRLGGQNVVAVSLHPGITQTPLSQHLTMDDFMELGPLDRAQGHKSHWGHSVQYKTLSQNVATHVFAAFDPSLNANGVNGSFLTDSQVVDPVNVHCWGRDLVDAGRLWALSEEIVGQKFDL